jgi:hypothetical protein
MDQKVGVDLRLAYRTDPVVQAICDVLTSYQRGVYQIMTHRMMMHLKAEGHAYNRSQVIAGFRKLEVVGVGKYVEGRHGWKSRFELGDRVTVIVKLLEVENIEDIDFDLLEIDEDEPLDESISHSFILRPSLRVLLDLPADLTQREADRLAQFVGCLAMDSA